MTKDENDFPNYLSISGVKELLANKACMRKGYIHLIDILSEDNDKLSLEQRSRNLFSNIHALKLIMDKSDSIIITYPEIDGVKNDRASFLLILERIVALESKKYADIAQRRYNQCLI